MVNQPTVERRGKMKGSKEREEWKGKVVIYGNNKRNKR